MNANFRSFFSILFLAATVIMTGCGTTGNANQDRVINGALAGAAIGGITAAVINTNNRPQQHAQHYPQQQSHPGCQNGARPYHLPDGRPACMMQHPQQQYQPQYQHQQCGMWNPDCNRPLQAPQIAQQPQYGNGQQMQQQGHPGCNNGAQPYRLPDGRSACMNR